MAIAHWHSVAVAFNQNTDSRESFDDLSQVCDGGKPNSSTGRIESVWMFSEQDDLVADVLLPVKLTSSVQLFVVLVRKSGSELGLCVVLNILLKRVFRNVIFFPSTIFQQKWTTAPMMSPRMMIKRLQLNCPAQTTISPETIITSYLVRIHQLSLIALASGLCLQSCHFNQSIRHVKQIITVVF